MIYDNMYEYSIEKLYSWRRQSLKRAEIGAEG